MSQIVERSSLDLRYQSYRLRNDAAEARLLTSIIERGIQEPLKGVDVPQGRRLLDGFRRCRCAETLHIECVPYVSVGEEEATGIIHLMRVDQQKPLNILEQAKFVAELLTTHALSVADVAESLSRSKAWSARAAACSRRSARPSRRSCFAAAFLSTRTWSPCGRHAHERCRTEEIEAFVQALAGQPLSVREIEWLAPTVTSAGPHRCGRRSSRGTGNGRSSRCERFRRPRRLQ